MRDSRDAKESDDLLAQRSREGDPRSLALLYRRFAPILLEYLQRSVRDSSEAEDVLQETFLALFSGKGQYEGRGRFKEWLFTVATHKVRDRWRQSQRRSEILAMAADALAGSRAPGPAESLAAREFIERVESALADLPPSYAMAFHLRLREGFSYREMASICQEPEGTLRSRVHHSLKRVREALRRGGIEAPHSRSERSGSR